MSDWWQFEAPRPRRPAKDGIRARSRRGAIGESWWSQRFLAALESLTDTGRLGRGRSYARTGQVMDLRVEPGRVTARVQGSRPTPYDVRVNVRPLGDEQWTRVEEAMAAQAVFMAALLAGEMPTDIETAFTAAGLSLFPASSQDLETGCSCPDWANPCKHVAATFYILAEAFDEDPFLIFAWRGRAKDQLVERLRARRTRATPPDAPADGGAADPERGEETEVAPLPASPADFWRAGEALDGVRFHPRAAEVPDALLRRLGPPPVDAGNAPLDEALAAAYRELTRAAARRAYQDE